MEIGHGSKRDCGRDRMVVGFKDRFIAIYAISAYHH